MGNTTSNLTPEEQRIQDRLNARTETESDLSQSYETLPNNIKVEEYEKLNEKLKIYYDNTNIQTKIIEDLGITIKYYVKRPQQEVNSRLEDIQSRIRSTEGIVLTYNEYMALPEQLRNDYMWEKQYPPGGGRVFDNPRSYKRGMLWSEYNEQQRLAKERRLQDIRTQPGIVISQEEYYALSSEIQQSFEWIFESVGYGGYGPSVGNYKKGRTAAQIQADKAARLVEIRTQQGIELTVPEYDALPADIKRDFEWLAYGSSSPYGESNIDGYRKGRTTVQVQADIAARLLQIRTQPGIEITVSEYHKLPADIQTGFEWIPVHSVNRGESSFDNKYQKGKSTTQIQADKYARYQVIRSTPEIVIDAVEYNSLPRDILQSFEWIPQNELFRGVTYAFNYKKGRSLGT